MKLHNIEIMANNQPTALERLLQVTRYRGFQVTDLSVSTNPETNMLAIKMSVNQPSIDGCLDRNGIERLYNQLNKLFDIKHVNLNPNSLAQQQG